MRSPSAGTGKRGRRGHRGVGTLQSACVWASMPPPITTGGNMYARITSLCAAVLLLGGCATILSGTSEELTVSTDPDDARIYVDGLLVGQGTTTFTASRSGAPPEIRVEKDGYRTQQFKPKSSFNGVALINSTFVLSWATDLVSGAVTQYDRNEYHVQLVKKGRAGLSPRQRIIRFSLSNWAVLRTNIASGDGDFLDGLAGIAGSQQQRADFRARVLAYRGELLAQDDPFAFAQQVSRLYPDAS